MTARNQSNWHYPDQMNLRVAKGFRAAVAQAAAVHSCAPTDYLRRVISEALRADGVKINSEAD